MKATLSLQAKGSRLSGPKDNGAPSAKPGVQIKDLLQPEGRRMTKSAGSTAGKYDRNRLGIRSDSHFFLKSITE